MRILIVEDDPGLQPVLAEAFSHAGHVVDVVADGASARDHLAAWPYDLAVLDRGLPDGDGLELCAAVRARRPDTPILVLTARDTLGDRVAGLDAGADDYLVKPFAVEELLARARALLRRPGGDRAPVLAVGDLRFDPATGEVTRGDRPVTLARKERALLEYLMRNAGRIVTRDQILDHVWDDGGAVESDVVRAHVKLLRRAIGDDGAPRLIETVHGVGWRLLDR